MEQTKLSKQQKQMFNDLYYRKEIEEEVKEGRSLSDVQDDYIVKKQPKKTSK